MDLIYQPKNPTYIQIPFDIVTVITNGGGPKDNKIHPGGLM